MQNDLCNRVSIIAMEYDKARILDLHFLQRELAARTDGQAGR